MLGAGRARQGGRIARLPHRGTGRNPPWPLPHFGFPAQRRNVSLVPVRHDTISNALLRKGMAVAKGQKKSNREVKKPKKTEAERQKAGQATAAAPFARVADRDAPKKS